MPKRTMVLTALSLIVLFDGSLSFPPGPAAYEGSTPCCGEASEVQPRQLHLAYYSLANGSHSTLLLVSDFPKALDFFLAVRSRSGQTALAPMMTIQPYEKLSIDLRKLLVGLSADVIGDFSEGSVTIYFNGTIMPLAGQVTITDPLRNLSLESQMIDSPPGLGLLPKELHGLWWGISAGRDATIVVTNTSIEGVSADVFLDFHGKRRPSGPLFLGPTKPGYFLLRTCWASSR